MGVFGVELVISVKMKITQEEEKGRSKRQIIEPLGSLQRKDVGTELKVIWRTEKQLLDN